MRKIGLCCAKKKKKNISEKKQSNLEKKEKEINPKAKEKTSETKKYIIPRSSFYKHPKIIIIGAGAAGIACAVSLIERGFNDVKILEAEDRIGGRIHTVPFANNVVDLGAQWCHGERNNVVYEMCKNLNLLESSGKNYVSVQCIRSNGEIVPDEVTMELKYVIGEIFEWMRTKLTNYSGSIGEFLEEEYFDAMRRPAHEHISRAIMREFFENFQKMESSESSVGLNDVSATGFLEYTECEGDYMLNWKDKGYKEFLRVLMRAKTNDSYGILAGKVIENTKVNKIIWNQSDGTVNVICENDIDAYEADNVVVTVSLGVLKKVAKDMFIPQLPPQKMLAIQGLGFGKAAKIFIEFPHIFWPSSWKGFATLWRKEDVYDLRMNGILWHQDIYGFYCVNYQPRILEAWAVSEAVPFIEQLSKNELKRHLMLIIRRFLSDWNIPEPVSVLASSWSTNSNFCGAYSFRTLFTESVMTSASELARPVDVVIDIIIDGQLDNILGRSKKVYSSKKKPKASLRTSIKPTILFAGEATSAHFFSTVHGAVESGWREAKRLAGYYSGLP